MKEEEFEAEDFDLKPGDSASLMLKRTPVRKVASTLLRIPEAVLKQVITDVPVYSTQKEGTQEKMWNEFHTNQDSQRVFEESAQVWSIKHLFHQWFNCGCLLRFHQYLQISLE